MSIPVFSDEEFYHYYDTLGPSKFSKLTGLSERAIYARRRRLEHRTGKRIQAPGGHKNALLHVIEEHAARLDVRLKSGVAIIGSDAHYWPGEPSTAHRAFCSFAKKMKPNVVIVNGDVMDFPRISRHPPIGWESIPEVQDEIEIAQERMHEIATAAGKARKIWLLGNHDCLDPATECLTRRGWIQNHDLRPDDSILSLVDDAVVWSPINEIVRFPYNGELVRVEKTRLSMAVTPNHRVLLKRLNWRSRQYDFPEYRRADDLPSSFDLPMAGQIECAPIDLSDDQIALAGWILTDGNYDKCSVNLYQSKPDGIATIDDLLTRLGLTFSRYERQRGRRAIMGRALLRDPLPSVQFRINVESSRHVLKWVPARGRLPDWAFDCDSRQFQVLLDAIVAGDGVWDGYNPAGKTCCVIYGMEPILSDIQRAAVMHGWRARLATDTRGHYRLCLSKEPKLRIERGEVYREQYSGEIWCLRVPHGNFMVRRNGSAYFTGNSRFETRLATVGSEYARVHGVHLRDHFPLWEPGWSAWINDQVVIKHRFKGGIHATHNNTMWAGKTTVTGHLHSLKITPFTDYNGTRYGIDSGCLADTSGKQFVDYTEDNPKNWRSGFVILTFIDGKLIHPELVMVSDHKKNHVEWRGELIAV